MKSFFATILQPCKQLWIHIDQYIDEKISKKYQAIPTEHRRKVKLYTGMVLCVCMILLLLVPISYIFSYAKAQWLSHSVKSPQELSRTWDTARIETYSDMISLPADAAQTVGYFWQHDIVHRIISHADTLFLEKQGHIQPSEVNFLHFTYDSRTSNQIKIYTKTLETFCMLDAPIAYQDQMYVAENPVITLRTENTFSTWEIFSSYTADTEEADRLIQKEKTTLYADLMAQSQIQRSNQGAQPDSKILVIIATDMANDMTYVIGATMTVP